MVPFFINCMLLFLLPPSPCRLVCSTRADDCIISKFNFSRVFTPVQLTSPKSEELKFESLEKTVERIHIWLSFQSGTYLEPSRWGGGEVTIGKRWLLSSEKSRVKGNRFMKY